MSKNTLKGLAVAQVGTIEEDWPLLNMADDAYCMVWSPVLKPLAPVGKWIGKFWGDKKKVIRHWFKTVPLEFNQLTFWINEADLEGDNGDSAHMTPRMAAYWYWVFRQVYPDIPLVLPNIGYRDFLHRGTVDPKTGVFRHDAAGKRLPWTRAFLHEVWDTWDYYNAWKDEKDLEAPFSAWEYVGFHWYPSIHMTPEMGPSWAYQQFSDMMLEEGLTKKRPGWVGEMSAPGQPVLFGKWLEDAFKAGLRVNGFTNRHDVLRKEQFAMVDTSGKLTPLGKVFAQF